jgi:pimeloyl-ACP methyl ester carboxylesterase
MEHETSRLLKSSAGVMSSKRAFYSLVFSVIALGIICAGCSTDMIQLREAPRNPLAEQLGLTSKEGPQATQRTEQLLRVNDLEQLLMEAEWTELLDQLQLLVERNPSSEYVYAIAEVAFLAGVQEESSSPDLAFDHYGLAVVYSYRYLFDPDYRSNRNPYDPHFRGACDLYNGALEQVLRLHLRNGGDFLPGRPFEIESAAGLCLIDSVIRGGRWNPEEIERFEFASDYEITGLQNQYHRYGLGVPLIAVRRGYEGEAPAAHYYPPNLSFPITAFFRMSPVEHDEEMEDGSACHIYHATLELFDAMTVEDAPVEDRLAPLEADLTTPLAYFLSDSRMKDLATVGLLSPDRLLDSRSWVPGGEDTTISGLYMVQPFEPGKIPVIMVHGLWSTPMTWMEMFNDLRGNPELRENYQFWFYLYPSGQPFWVSAGQMRRDLEKFRDEVDPRRLYPALDNMVLVGHSMGGLVSRLQTVESDDKIWRLVSDAPFEEVQGTPELSREVEQWMFFHPNPSIRRVITLGTPHRGSRFSNNATQWLSSKLINLPKTFADYMSDFTTNNDDLIRDDTLLRINNSIDSLSPDSPFFAAMLACEQPSWMRYHNVVGLVPEDSWTAFIAGRGDGVVPYGSAIMPDVLSQIEVEADHISIHTHPRAVLEVRRILIEHLSEVRSGTIALPPGRRVAEREVETPLGR